MNNARHIVVVGLGCDDLLVIVRNPTGSRQDWQLPGSRLQEDEDVMSGVVRVCSNEIGVTVKSDMAREIKQFTLRNEQGTKTFTSFFVRVSRSVLNNIKPRGPQGHTVMVIRRDDMRYYLVRKQLALLNP